MKKPANFYLDVDLIDKLKDLAYRDRATLSHMIDLALRSYIQNDYLANGKCPQREQKMPGRPINVKSSKY